MGRHAALARPGTGVNLLVAMRVFPEGRLVPLTAITRRAKGCAVPVTFAALTHNWPRGDRLR